DDKPRGERPSFGEDRPRREFNSDRPRREFNSDRPRREFNEDRPRREFNSDRPRRDFNDKPRFEGNDDNRGNRVDYKPRTSFRTGGERAERSFGGEDRPRREFKPEFKSDFKSDRPRRERETGDRRRKFSD
ncbi:MAG: DEAD/DEAH box helicase, partial [Acinetobacter sp.]